MARARRSKKTPSSGTNVLFMFLGVILGGLVIMEGLSQLLFHSSLSGANYITWNKERDQNKAHYDVTPMKAIMIVLTASPIRQSPAKSSMKVGTLKPKGRVQVTGTIKANKASWYEIVRFDGRPGYVPATSLSR
jgi:hypothetical protein